MSDFPSGSPAVRSRQLHLKQQRLTMPPAAASSRATSMSGGNAVASSSRQRLDNRPDTASGRPAGSLGPQPRASTGSSSIRPANRDVEVIDLTAVSDDESVIMITETVEKVPNPMIALQARPRLSKRSLLQAERTDTLLDTGGLPLRRGSGTHLSSAVNHAYRTGSQRSTDLTPSQRATKSSQSSSARQASLLLRSPTASPGIGRVESGGSLHTSSFAMSRQSSSASLASQSGLDLGRRRLLQSSSGSGSATVTPSRIQNVRSPVKRAAFNNTTATSGSAGKQLTSSVWDRRITKSPRSVLARLLSNSPTKLPSTNGPAASAKHGSFTARPASTSHSGSAHRDVIYVTSGSEDDRGSDPLGQPGQQRPIAASSGHQSIKISPLKRDRPTSMLLGSGVAREGSDTPKKARVGTLAPTASNPFLDHGAAGTTQPGLPSSSKEATSKAFGAVKPDGGATLLLAQGTSQTTNLVSPEPTPVDGPSEIPVPPSSSPEKRPCPADSLPVEPPSSAPIPSQSSTKSGLTSRTASTEIQGSESGRAKRVRPSAGAYTIPDFDAPDDEWRDRTGRSIPLAKGGKKRTATGSSSQAPTASRTLTSGPVDGAQSSAVRAGPSGSGQTSKAALPGPLSEASTDRRDSLTPKAGKLAPTTTTRTQAGPSAASPLKRIVSIVNDHRTPVKASGQAADGIGSPLTPLSKHRAGEIGSPLTPLPKHYEESVVLSARSSKIIKTTSMQLSAEESTQPCAGGKQGAVEEEEDLLLAFADFEYTIDESGNLSKTPSKASQRSLPGSTRKSAPLSPNASLASIASRRAALSPTQMRLPLIPSRTANSLSPTVLKRQLLRATPSKSPVTATIQTPAPRDIHAELMARREEERKQQAEIERLAEERREQWQRALAGAVAEADDAENAVEFMQKLAAERPDPSRRSARISGTHEAESPPDRRAPPAVRDPKTSEFDKFVRAEERKDKKGISDERIAQAIRDAAAATKALKNATETRAGYPTPEGTASPHRPTDNNDADAGDECDNSASLEAGIDRVDLARVRAILEKGVEGDGPDARTADLTMLDDQLIKDAKRELERRKQAKLKPQRGGRPKIQWTGFWTTPSERAQDAHATGDKAVPAALPLSTWVKLTRGNITEDIISRLPQGLMRTAAGSDGSMTNERALLSAAVTLPTPQCEMALCALENYQLHEKDDPFDEEFLDLVLVLLARLGARQDLLPKRESMRHPVEPTLTGPDFRRQWNAACIAIARLSTVAERDGGLDTDVATGLMPVFLLLALDSSTTDDSFRAISDALHALWPTCLADKTAIGAAMEIVDLVRNESIQLQHAVLSTIGTRSVEAREASRWTAIALLVPGCLESLTLDGNHTVPPPDLLTRGSERIFQMLRSKSAPPDPVTLGCYIDFLYASMTDWDALVKLCAPDAHDKGSELFQGLPKELATVRSAVGYGSRALKIDMDSEAQMFRNKTRLDQLQRVIGLRGTEATKRLRRANRPSLGQSLREGEGGQTKLAFGVK